MVALSHKPVPNPWQSAIPRARSVTIEAGKNLSYTVRSFTVRPGEPIQLTFLNPDVVPHNWALIKPGTLPSVGDLVNKIVAEPDAASRHYIPRTDDVLVYTDIVGPQDQFVDLLPRPDHAGTVSLPLHLPRALDGHERGDDRKVSEAISMAVKAIVRYMILCDDWEADEDNDLRLNIYGLLILGTRATSSSRQWSTRRAARTGRAGAARVGGRGSSRRQPRGRRPRPPSGGQSGDGSVTATVPLRQLTPSSHPGRPGPDATGRAGRESGQVGSLPKNVSSTVLPATDGSAGWLSLNWFWLMIAVAASRVLLAIPWPET